MNGDGYEHAKRKRLKNLRWCIRPHGHGHGEEDDVADGPWRRPIRDDAKDDSADGSCGGKAAHGMLMSLLLEYGQLASLVAAEERGWPALAYTIFIGGIVAFGLWFWLIARCSIGASHPSVCSFRCLPRLATGPPLQPVPSPAGHRYDHALGQGHVPDVWRLCRVRARHDRGARQLGGWLGPRPRASS